MNSQIKIGAVLQYTQMALSILIGVIYTPIMLNFLGQSEYGLYNIAASIISYLSLLSLGFGSSYIRFYTIRKKTEPERLGNLNGLYFATFIFIGLIAIISGILLAFNVKYFLNDSYSIKDFDTAKVLMIVLAVNLGLSFPASLFTSYITAHERFVFLKIINIGKTVLSPALSIIALFYGFGSIGVVASLSIINFIIDIINVIYCLKRLKMRFSFRSFEFRMFKDIFVFSALIAVNQLIDQINWQTDKIILGKVMTGAAVSIYAIGSTLNNYYIQFSTAISSLYVPKINKIVIENKQNKNDELLNIMILVGKLQFIILSLILLGFVFFGQYFIIKWAGKDYGLSYYVALLLMIPETVPLIQNVGIEIQRAENKHKFRSIVYLIMAIINVGMSILLCLKFGIIGVTLGTTVSIVIANIIIMNIYYHKNLKINMLKFWYEILKIIPLMILPIAIGMLSITFAPITTIFDFIRQIAFFSFTYCLWFGSIYFVNKKE